MTLDERFKTAFRGRGIHPIAHNALREAMLRDLGRATSFIDRMSIQKFAESPGAALRSALRSASECHGVTVAAIMGRSRLGPVVAARQDAFLALRHAGWSYPDIGKAMDRDHGTIIHGVARAMARQQREASE